MASVAAAAAAAAALMMMTAAALSAAAKVEPRTRRGVWTATGQVDAAANLHPPECCMINPARLRSYANVKSPTAPASPAPDGGLGQFRLFKLCRHSNRQSRRNGVVPIRLRRVPDAAKATARVLLCESAARSQWTFCGQRVQTSGARHAAAPFQTRQARPGGQDAANKTFAGMKTTKTLRKGKAI